MTDANHHTALPEAEAEEAAAHPPTRIHHTYVVGEDDRRLANAAHYFGLASARRPLGNVRRAVTAMFHDHTLESARMHSVGVLAEDERVDQSGTLHLMTLTHRKRRKDVNGVMTMSSSNEPPTSYGNLKDLFHKGPIITASTIEDDDDDHEEEEVLEDTVEGGSLTAAVFGIIKGTVGPAILYLPRGFQLSGYAVAIPSMILATLSYLYSARRLLQCWKAEKEKMARLEELRGLLEPASTTTTNYGSVEAATKEEATTALLTYPELARRAFGSGSAVVELGIALMQFGVCLTYLIFVPQNLVESVKVLFGYQVDKLYFLIGMVLVEIPLSWIRDIRKLTPTNILATFLIAYGLVSCLAIAWTVAIQDPNSTLIERIIELPATNDTWYLFIGTSVSGSTVV
jgi:proton-coupled amino acid transporter